MRLLTLLALAVALQVPAAQSASPSMPFVQWGACPFEGCTYQDWTARTSVVAVGHPASTWMDSTAPSVPTLLFSVKPGERVTAMTGVVVVTKPGRAQVRKPKRTTSVSRQFPRMSGTPVDLAANETIYLLDYHGEGEWTGWVRGQLINFLETEDGAVVERPESVWWVKIRNSRGQIGWTTQARAFGNTDALGGPEPDYAAFSYDLSREPWTDLLPGIKIKPIVGETGTFVFLEMMPRAQSTLHHHRQEQGNFGIKGSFVVSMGGHLKEVRPGTGTLMPPDVQHFIANRGTDVVQLLEFQSIRRLDLLQPRTSPTYVSAPGPAALAASRATVTDFSGSGKRLSGVQSSYTVIDVAKSAAPANLRPLPVTAEQFFYVLAGEIEVTVGTARQRVRAGELLLVPRRAAKVTAVPIGSIARLLRFDPGKP